jgi:IS605 OrfB family transposase
LKDLCWPLVARQSKQNLFLIATAPLFLSPPMVITRETLVLGACDSQGNALSLAQAEGVLAEIAACLGRAKRAYFVERWARGDPPSLAALKKKFSQDFGLTHRQFTAIRLEIDGKAAGRIEAMKLESESLAGRIASAEERIKAWNKKSSALLKQEEKRSAWERKEKARVGAALAKGAKAKPKARPKALADFNFCESRRERSALKRLIQAKTRKIAKMAAKKASLDQDIKAKRPRICFGGSKLFKAQNHLAENGFQDHAEWLAAWRAQRDSQIFCVGSHDESHGNQSATLIDSETLRLRIPPALEKKHGLYLFVKLKAFRKGQEEVEAACRERKTCESRAQRKKDGQAGKAQAVSWRLSHKQARRGAVWVAQASFESAPAPKAPLWGCVCGALGVDFNADHLALSLINRHGNPVRATGKRGREILAKIKDIPFDTRGKSREQVDAMVGEAVARIVAIAMELSVPIVAEKLDFAAKKHELGERPKQYSRMLSSLAYSKFHKTLERRADREGATVMWVNPAFTSVIGQAKFAIGYQMTPHQAAACAIARRGLRFKHSESKITRSRAASPGASPSETGFSGPARTRGKHAWSDWGRVGAWRRARRLESLLARKAAKRSENGAAGPRAVDSAILKAGAGARALSGEGPGAPTFCDHPPTGESRAQAGRSCSPGGSMGFLRLD